MKVFKNQITDPKNWGKLTTEAHLANLGMTSIQTSKMIERLVDLDSGLTILLVLWRVYLHMT